MRPKSEKFEEYNRRMKDKVARNKLQSENYGLSDAEMDKYERKADKSFNKHFSRIYGKPKEESSGDMDSFLASLKPEMTELGRTMARNAFAAREANPLTAQTPWM